MNEILATFVALEFPKKFKRIQEYHLDPFNIHFIPDI
jgi:hypothetical protein